MLGAGAGLSAGKRVQQRHFPDLRPVRSLTAVANEPRRGGPIGKLHTLGAGAIVAHAVRAAVGEGAPSLSVLSASAQTARRNGALNEMAHGTTLLYPPTSRHTQKWVTSCRKAPRSFGREPRRAR